MCTKLPTIPRVFKLQRRRINLSTISSLHIAKDTSPDTSDFISMYDQRNDISFIIDSASPKSIVPIHMFPSFHGNSCNFCNLLTADGHPLKQFGSLDLILQFHDFPDKKFIHTFLLADVHHAILGLDFLKKYHFTIDAFLQKVYMPEFVLKENQIPEKQQIDYAKLSLPDILELFPDLNSGQIRVDSKLHPFEHQMDVSGSPIAFRPRRLNPEKKQELDTQLDEMLRLNIIHTSTSPWASPVHLVKKKDDL